MTYNVFSGTLNPTHVDVQISLQCLVAIAGAWLGISVSVFFLCSLRFVALFWRSAMFCLLLISLWLGVF